MMVFFLVSCGEEKKEEPVLTLPELPDAQTNIGTQLDTPIFSCQTVDSSRVIVFHNREAGIFSAIYGDLLTPIYQIQKFSAEVSVERSYNVSLTEGGVRLLLKDDITTAQLTLLYRDTEREGLVEFFSNEKGTVDTFCIPGTIQTELHVDSLWDHVHQVE